MWREAFLPKQSAHVSSDEVDAIGVCVIVDLELLFEGSVCEDDDLEFGECFLVELFGAEDIDRDVAIELSDPRECSLVSRLPNVRLSQEELCS